MRQCQKSKATQAGRDDMKGKEVEGEHRVLLYAMRLKKEAGVEYGNGGSAKKSRLTSMQCGGRRRLIEALLLLDSVLARLGRTCRQRMGRNEKS